MSDVLFITASISAFVGLVLGGILAPKPLVREYRGVWIAGFIILILVFLLCALALNLKDNWASISSIAAAVIVAVSTVLAQDQIQRKKENEKKAEAIVSKRMVTITNIYNQLLACHGVVSQNRYHIESAISKTTVAENQIVPAMTDAYIESILIDRFNSLLTWPRIETIVPMPDDLNDPVFPNEYMELYAILFQVRLFYAEFDNLNKKFIHFFNSELSLKLSRSKLPDKNSFEASIGNIPEREFGIFVSYYEILKNKCIASEESIRECLLYIVENQNDLIVGEIQEMTSKRFVESRSWERAGFETKGFDYARSSWEEIFDYYKENNLDINH